MLVRVIVAVSCDGKQVDHPIDDGQQFRTEMGEALGYPVHQMLIPR